MKQIIVLFGIFCLTAGCHKAHVPHASLISVVCDQTDSFALHPIPDPILALYDFQSDRDQAAMLRLVVITDKKLNPVEEIRIADGETSEKGNVRDEVHYRDQLILWFYNAARKSFIDFQTAYAPGRSLSRSEVFATIAAELENLANSAASQRTLIVYSDLAENEEDFSCYTEDGQKMLATDPDKVARVIEHRHILPKRLTGITVYFVFEPLTREQDMRFGQMVGMYKRFLRERGARVVIQANNQFFEP